MLVSYIVVSFGRPSVLKECIECISKQKYEPMEIIVVDANPEGYSRDLHLCNVEQKKLQIVRLGENRGVAGNRNVGMQYARGDILVFIDDDALLKDPNATQIIVSKFQTQQDTGALGFRSINFYTQEIEDFPRFWIRACRIQYNDNIGNRLNKEIASTKELEVTHFVGVGHAIRRKLLNETGLYPEGEFFYGMEEYYLSFRILDSGYKIFYTPNVTVYHKLSPGGRVTPNEKHRLKLENKLRIAVRLMPLRYVTIWFLLRSMQTLVSTKGNFSVVFRGWKSIIRDLPKLKSERKVLSNYTIKKIYSLGGTLLY